MFSQLTAANTTMSQNLYIQKVENGTLKLLLANQTAVQDPSITKCLYFTQDRSKDVQLYAASFETKLQDVKKDLDALGPSDTHKADLVYLKDKSIKLN